MLGSEDFIVIQALVHRGVYLCDIAQQLGVHPKTVRRTPRPPALRHSGRGAPGRLRVLEGWYNPHRRHSALDYESPISYEKKHRPAA